MKMKKMINEECHKKTGRETESGSITVFLSLILLILFSFTLTGAEAARQNASKAYLSMLGKLAGSSFLSTYYFPLLEEFDLFGVDAGYNSSFLKKEMINDALHENIEYAVLNTNGGMISFADPSVTLTGYSTLLDNDCNNFFSQIRKQSVYDGAQIALNSLFTSEETTEMAVVNDLIVKQQKVEEAIVGTAEETLMLMRYIDGIKTNAQGIDFSSEGRIDVVDHYVKRICTSGTSDVYKEYTETEISGAIANKQMDIEAVAQSIMDEAYDFLEYEDEVKAYLEGALNASEAEEKLIDSAEAVRIENELKDRKHEIYYEYGGIYIFLGRIDEVILDAVAAADKLYAKQVGIQQFINTYEEAVDEVYDEIPDKYKVIFKETSDYMAQYAKTSKEETLMMLKTLKENHAYINRFLKQRVNEENPKAIIRAMETLTVNGKEYSYEGLWFDYQKTTSSVEVDKGILNKVKDILSDGVLNYAGISKEHVSNAEISGNELVSVMEDNNILKDYKEMAESLCEMIRQKDFSKVLEMIEDKMCNEAAMQIYIMGHFGSYNGNYTNRNLQYEKEYIAFGNNSDKENLTQMVLTLVALRSIYTNAMVFTDAEKQAEMYEIAVSLLGFTGCAPLIIAAKYVLLEVLAFEEAIVQTAAILSGKKLLYTCPLCINVLEMFVFTPQLVNMKVQQIPSDPVGTGYEEYLIFVLVLTGTRRKAFRTMDLIQEYLRDQYRDSFRIRNTVIGIDYVVEAELDKKYDTGILPNRTYITEVKNSVCY